MKETPEYSIILGNVVKEARARSGITQSELADTIEAANRTVLNIENGRGNPKLEVRSSLSSGTGIKYRCSIDF